MGRITSVDTLRGITIIAMILVNNPGSWSNVYPPLLHASWHGITPTDLIFPFFLFIVGIAIALAYENKKPSKSTYKKIVVRSTKLIGLGLFINVFTPNFPFFENLQEFRIPGVLQRIGLVFFVSSVLFLNSSEKTIVLTTIGLLLGYFLLLGFVSLPNGAMPSYENNLNNWANYIDYNILGKHMWQELYDPEGLLSTIPSVATCLLGILAGLLLTRNTRIRKEYVLLICGVSLLLLGYVWNIWFPINKTFWSSSYVLVTAGYAFIILSITYYLNDVKKINPTKIFTYVSRNAITVYFLSMVVAKSFYSIKVNETENIHTWLYHNFYTNFLGDASLASFLYAVTVVSFYVLLSRYLFKKQIFLKV